MFAQVERSRVTEAEADLQKVVSQQRDCEGRRSAVQTSAHRHSKQTSRHRRTLLGMSACCLPMCASLCSACHWQTCRSAMPHRRLFLRCGVLRKTAQRAPLATTGVRSLSVVGIHPKGWPHRHFKRWLLPWRRRCSSSASAGRLGVEVVARRGRGASSGYGKMWWTRDSDGLIRR